MQNISAHQNASAKLGSRHTTVFDLDTEGRIVSLPECAAQIIDACPDVVGIDENDRFMMSEPTASLASPTPIRLDGVPQNSLAILYSVAAKAKLTIHILKREGIGATIVVFVPGLSTTENFPSLTPRERDVLLLAAKGLRRDRMAHALGVSIPTIDLHCASLRGKVGAKTTSEAVAKAFPSLRV